MSHSNDKKNPVKLKKDGSPDKRVIVASTQAKRGPKAKPFAELKSKVVIHITNGRIEELGGMDKAKELALKLLS